MSSFPSFVPYIREEGPFLLRISLQVEDDPRLLERHPFPFMVLFDQSPLARLIEGVVVSDLGQEVRDVFLWVQRDNYRIFRLPPFVNNAAIDRTWREQFSVLLKAQGQSPWPTFLPLKAQLGPDGGLLPFAPLWFCKRVKSYFPAVCPKCGEPLEECRDDALLSAEGLSPYSSSLRRYLYCPRCYPSGNREFYCYGREKDDPPSVKDRLSLLKAMGELIDEGRGQEIPCSRCPEKGECYGEEGRVQQRVVPFSFYPFYLFVFHGAGARLEDMIELLDGASPEEVMQRLKERRAFGPLRRVERVLGQGGLDGGLEARVALLEGAARAVEGLHRQLGADLNLVPGRFWADPQRAEVKLLGLPAQVKIVPEGYPEGWDPLALPFWRGSDPFLPHLQGGVWREVSGFFTVKAPPSPEKGMAVEAEWIGDPLEEGDLLSLSFDPSMGFPREVTVWFEVRGREGEEGWILSSPPLEGDMALVEVFGDLSQMPPLEVSGELYRRPSPREDLYSLGLLWMRTLLKDKGKFGEMVKAIEEVLEEGAAAEELQKRFPHIFEPQAPEELWFEALSLGWELLMASKGLSHWSWEGFWERFEALKGRPGGERLVLLSAKGREEKDEAILEILCDIEDSLKESPARDISSPQPQKEEVEEEIEETVLLSSKTQEVQEEGEELMETVILSSKTDQPEPEPSAGQQPAEEELEETVILPPKDGGDGR